MNDIFRLSSERGGSLVEFVLLITLIVVVILAALTVLGNEVSDSLAKSNKAMVQ